MLGGGRVNLYSLFVERAMNLIKPDGIVGLLTPSGIYADKTAAPFFKSVSTSGRVGGLFDFENRRLGTNLPPFFPDVDSRFKFCALIFGGEERRFAETECAFFLHDTAAIHDPDRCFPWPRPTSPASTPTPAPPLSSARAATPTSPVASTNAIPCWSTAPAMGRKRYGRCGTCNVQHDFRLASLPDRPPSLKPTVSTRCMATDGRRERSCICPCTRDA